MPARLPAGARDRRFAGSLGRRGFLKASVCGSSEAPIRDDRSPRLRRCRLDPAIEFWEPPERPQEHRPASRFCAIEIGTDGQSIVVPWLGSHPEVETYSWAEIIETPTAAPPLAHGRTWATKAGLPRSASSTASPPA